MCGCHGRFIRDARRCRTFTRTLKSTYTHTLIRRHCNVNCTVCSDEVEPGSGASGPGGWAGPGPALQTRRAQKHTHTHSHTNSRFIKSKTLLLAISELNFAAAATQECESENVQNAPICDRVCVCACVVYMRVGRFISHARRGCNPLVMRPQMFRAQSAKRPACNVYTNDGGAGGLAARAGYAAGDDVSLSLRDSFPARGQRPETLKHRAPLAWRSDERGGFVGCAFLCPARMLFMYGKQN